MKKIVTTAAALAMAATLSLTAFAAGNGKLETNNATKDITVNAQYSNTVTEAEVISVDITWGAMSFTYSESGSKTWDPSDHTYEDNSTTGWVASGNTITVTNHSNVDVKANFTYMGKNASAPTGSFTYNKTAEADGSIKLTRGLEGNYATAPAVTATLNLSGALDSSKTTATEIGKVTVKITK